MKKNIIAAALCAVLCSTPVLAAPAVTVNGQGIEKSVIDGRIKQMEQQSNGQVKDTPELRTQITEQMINETLAAQDAKKRGLDKDKAFQNAMNEFQTKLLQDAFVADTAKKVSDSDVKKAYDQYVKNVKGSQEVKLRQIITDSQTKTDKALAELNKGKPFASVAKTYSEDGFAANGGLIDSWANLKEFEMSAPPIYSAISTLSKGQYTKQILSFNGNYILFYIEDKRNAIVPKYDEAKNSIRAQLIQMKVAEQIEQLRKAANIKR